MTSTHVHANSLFFQALQRDLCATQHIHLHPKPGQQIDFGIGKPWIFSIANAPWLSWLCFVQHHLGMFNPI